MNKGIDRVKKWISSLSGFQGGNPSSKIWFCGLEYQACEIGEEAKEPLWTVDNPPHQKSNTVDEKEKFNRNMLALAEAYCGDKLDLSKINLFAKDSILFKMNLFPLPQPRSTDSYSEEVYKETGFRTKSELFSYCLKEDDISPGRFQNFRKLLDLNKDNVEVVVCCSTSYFEYFLLAFSEKDDFYRLKDEMTDRAEVKNGENLAPDAKGRYKKYYYWGTLGKTLIFVIPFLTGHYSSLNDSQELRSMGKLIKEKVDEYKARGSSSP